jgi:hypothetical protein
MTLSFHSQTLSFRRMEKSHNLYNQTQKNTLSIPYKEKSYVFNFM